MKILYLAYDFPPLEASGTLRNRAFADLLPLHQIEPVIICADTSRAVQKYCGGYSIHEGWKDNPAWPEVKRIAWSEDAVELGFFERLAQRLPGASSIVGLRKRNERVDKIVDAGCDAIAQHSPDLIFCSVWPPSTALAGERLASRFKLPLIIDIRDPWSYGPRVPYRHVIDFYIERAIERRVLSAAKMVITPTLASRELLVEKLGIPGEKTRVIPNGYVETPVLSKGEIEPGVFTLLHAGEIGAVRSTSRSLSHRIKKLLRMDYDPMERDFGTRSVNVALGALDLLLRRRPEFRNKVRLRLLGSDRAEIQNAISRSECADRVIAERRVSQEAADEFIHRADALLLLQVSYWLEGRPFCPAVPAKLYSYLASGRPIIASAQDSEITDLITSTGSGSVVGPGAVGDLSYAIEAAVNDWESGREAEYVWSDKAAYSRVALTKQLAQCLFSAARA